MKYEHKTMNDENKNEPKTNPTCPELVEENDPKRSQPVVSLPNLFQTRSGAEIPKVEHL